MNSLSTLTDSPAVYIERLQQAKRVMHGLTAEQRARNFSIRVYAIASEQGIIACAAGYCGLDPWFQSRGFYTRVGTYMGDVSLLPDEFFGTGRPFYVTHYRKSADDITVDDVISALDRAIENFSPPPTGTECDGSNQTLS